MDITNHTTYVNTSCSSSALPDSLPGVPSNLTYIFVTSQTSPDQWMTDCCAPNPVHYEGACYEWCEPPSSDDGKTSADIVDNFDMCAAGAGRNSSHSHGIGIANVQTAAAPLGVDCTALPMKLAFALALTVLVRVIAF